MSMSVASAARWEIYFADRLVKFCIQREGVKPTFRIVFTFENSALYWLEKSIAQPGAGK